MTTRWAVGRDQIRIPELFEETSERAHISLDTEKPQSGNYAVLVDAEVLAVLMNGQVSQLSGANSYHGLPFVKPGSALIPDAQGAKITLKLDPRLEFGADTAVFSDQGLLQEPLELVRDGVVCATSADQQYASYLGIKPTTVRGTVVLAPGAEAHDELVRAKPQVLEILQFSGRFADPNTGTFGSEIRLAKLYDNRAGTVRTIKGGSLSGSIRENFRDLRLSRETVQQSHFESSRICGQGYLGPKYALLNDVSIVGEN
jgi:predicted Zn-dependent protease